MTSIFVSIHITEITKIWTYKCGKSDSGPIRYVYNKFANFIESYFVNFDPNEPSNIPEMMSVIGKEGMVWSPCLRDYLTASTNNLIKPTPMETTDVKNIFAHKQLHKIQMQHRNSQVVGIEIFA